MARTLEELSRLSRRDFATKLVALLRVYPSETGTADINLDRAEARWRMLSAIGNDDALRSALAGTPDIASQASMSERASSLARNATYSENAGVRALLARNLVDRFEDYLRDERAVAAADWLLLIDQYCGDYSRLATLGSLLRGIGRYVKGDSDATIDIQEADQLGRQSGASAPLRVATLCMVARNESDGGKRQASAAAASIEEAIGAAAGDQGLVDQALELRDWISRRSEFLALLGSKPGDGETIARAMKGGAAGVDLFPPLWSDAIGACVSGRVGEAIALCQTMDALARSLQCKPDRLRTLGLVAVLNSSWPIGEALLRAARQESSDEETIIMLARALRHQAKTDEAIDLLGEAVKRFPANADAWRDLGLCMMDRGETRMARQALAKALAINPDDALAGMAFSELDSGAAVAFDPESGTLEISPGLMKAGPEAAAAAITAAIIKSTPGDLEENIARYTEGKGPEFVRQVRAALGATSAAPREQGSLERAQDLFQARRFGEAKEAYAKAIAERPNDAYAHMALGDCHYMMGEFHLASAYFEESIAIEPTRSTWRFLGDAYRKVGRIEKARAAYESALALDPTYHIARQQLDAINAEQRDDRQDAATIN